MSGHWFLRRPLYDFNLQYFGKRAFILCSQLLLVLSVMWLFTNPVTLALTPSLIHSMAGFKEGISVPTVSAWDHLQEAGWVVVAMIDLVTMLLIFLRYIPSY